MLHKSGTSQPLSSFALEQVQRCLLPYCCTIWALGPLQLRGGARPWSRCELKGVGDLENRLEGPDLIFPCWHWFRTDFWGKVGVNQICLNHLEEGCQINCRRKCQIPPLWGGICIAYLNV